MKIGIAQINTTIGDLTGNAALIFAAYEKLVAEGADLVLTPELALTGYPPQDLLFESAFVEENLATLSDLEKKIEAVPLVVGFVDKNEKSNGKFFYNAAAVLRKETARLVAHKQLLPTYDVFDETRYFEPGRHVTSFSHQGKMFGITICEDLWTRDYLPREFYSLDPAQELITQGAEVILNLSASPFELGKAARRLIMLQQQADRLNVPIVYCNAVGGNDQLIFDGHSLVVAPHKKPHAVLASCREEHRLVDLAPLFYAAATSISLQNDEEFCNRTPIDDKQPDHAENSVLGSFQADLLFQKKSRELQELHDALVLGLRDYLRKCGFQRALLGLSGGIDSAVVAALAATALGSEQVTGVLMPGPHSSQGSIDDARVLANNLLLPHFTLPITPLYDETKKTLNDPFSNFPEDATEENLQARLRGVVLMALSNKFGSLLLTTGNKSELAVGYCTLYGDMCGALAVIADVPKTLVYQLAQWLNRDQEIIPWNSIHKAPSAELRPNQKDQDSLPPYEVLDQILHLFLEKHQSIAQIVAHGFDEKIVRWILRQVHRNEYKRQQAAPGLRVTSKAFGLGRRFPIAQRYC